jgi:hypothetical protein
MNLKTFENKISDTILQRGKSYYEDGAVANLQGMENGQWFAKRPAMKDELKKCLSLK